MANQQTIDYIKQVSNSLPKIRNRHVCDKCKNCNCTYEKVANSVEQVADAIGEKNATYFFLGVALFVHGFLLTCTIIGLFVVAYCVSVVLGWLL